ncbi:MAG TPA: Hsp20/alpha crystallin family protein [Candidatus Eisenbacteria bacterium]|jgi:HSP20 family protein|nr:Hsp20/alpha crystallin family protein [Candidatus Eisenbacteria bacterium]
MPPYMGYPGTMSYPWSRFSHGLDPSYEDWQGPGFGMQPPGGWEPPTHSYEKDDTMVVRMELPGWDREEVTVSVEDDDLVVEGRRQEGGEADDEPRLSREGRHGMFRAERFMTRVPLPTTVDATKVRAKFKNGILDIRVPLPERRTERRAVRIET